MVQLIDKAALVAEIEKLMGNPELIEDWRYRVKMEEKNELLKSIINTIDTLEVIKIGVDLGDPKGDKSAKYIIDTKTIEVKEMDLNKEIDAFFNDWGKDMINGGQYGINLDIRECKDIAKHFFELGMAVSNKQN